MTEKIYYVYFYLREHDSDNAAAGTPYYVGVGKGKRIDRKAKGEVSLPPNKTLRIKVQENLIAHDALELEKMYIKQFGRIDIGTGILRNKTDGGDGTHGRVMPIEERKRRSIIQKETQNRPDVVAKRAAGMAAANSTIETKEKRSRSAKLAAERPGVKDRVSLESRTRWADPEYRKTQSIKKQLYWDNEERKAEKSQVITDKWKDPDYATKVKTGIRAALNTPESREKRSKAHTGMKFWNNGVHNVRSQTCPKGYVAGRMKLPKD